MKPTAKFRYKDRAWVCGAAILGWDEKMIVGIFLGMGKALDCAGMRRMLAERRAGAVIEEWANGLRA